MKKDTKIISFSVSRLFNLGNYENVKYEFTVEVGEGKSPVVALRNAMRILKAISPKPPVTIYDYEVCKEKIAKPKEYYKDIADKAEQKRLRKEMVDQAKKVVVGYELWLKRRRAAERMIDNIGGTVTPKDAKLSWDDDDPFDV